VEDALNLNIALKEVKLVPDVQQDFTQTVLDFSILMIVILALMVMFVIHWEQLMLQSSNVLQDLIVQLEYLRLHQL